MTLAERFEKYKADNPDLFTKYRAEDTEDAYYDGAMAAIAIIWDSRHELRTRTMSELLREIKQRCNEALGRDQGDPK